MKTKISYSSVSVDFVKHTNLYENRIVHNKWSDVVNIGENENFMRLETTWGFVLIPIEDIKYVIATKSEQKGVNYGRKKTHSTRDRDETGGDDSGIL